jgi:hypothetical protein
MDVTSTIYSYNRDSASGFADGMHEDRSDWSGHFYPRGIISWALLNAQY